MERTSFVRHGVLRLPPGFRFHPTDEELVAQYLRRKAFSCPLPASIIPEIDLARYDPWDLPGGGSTEERYFFNLREAKYPTGNRSNRATGSGYWKATGKDKPVVAGNQVVGMKKVLVFYQGKPPKGSRTDWVMHEYRLAGDETNNKAPTKDWVLCRIFMKKRAAARMGDARVGKNGISFIDFMRQRDSDRCPSPSSSLGSDSSCVTEISDGSSSGEETSSSP